jgi:membrane protease YdiL (CAAX protease family)
MDTVASTRQSRSTELLPMSFWQSLGFFGIPWLFFVLSIYVLLPALDRAGVPIFLNFLISLGIPLGLLIVASCVAYRREGRPWVWNEFRDRFRLGAMRPSTWLWSIGLSVFMFLAPAFLNFTSVLIQQVAPIPAPLPRMFDLQPTSLMGIPLDGAWWIFLGYLFYVLMNVFGEELWWRGYILPRQELAFGKWTWVVHGLLWDLFHSFFYWELILFLPGCLALAFVAYKCKSTWPGIIAHFAFSLPGLVVVLIGILH